MKPTRILAVAAAVAAGALLSIPLALAGDPSPAPDKVVQLGNATCPVTGEAVKADVTTVWNGVEVAFCCAECPPKFTAKPMDYAPALLKDMATQLAAAKAKIAECEAGAKGSGEPAKPGSDEVPPPPPANAGPIDIGNASCPVMGGKSKPAVFTLYHGMKVHFCCAGCDKKFQADPTGYLAKLRADPAVAKKIDEAEAAWSADKPR